MTENERANLARFYGFNSYAGLRAISQPLPMEPGDTFQSYVARRPDGGWFVWEDKPPPRQVPDNGKYGRLTERPEQP